MQIITENHYSEFLNLVNNTKKEIQIIVPFISFDVVESLLQKLQKNNFNITLITRFCREDFLSGASSIKALEEFAKNNVALYAIQNLHTKLYLFDDDVAILGSANLTNGGLLNNVELSVKFQEKEVINQLHEYFSALFSFAKKFPITKKQIEQENLYLENHHIETKLDVEKFHYGAKLNATELSNLKNYHFQIIDDLKRLPDTEIAKILATLPPKLRDIIRLKFNIGVNSNISYGFNKIGELLELKAKNNRAYPRQALALGLCKLRNPLRFKIFKEDYIG